MIEVDQFWPHFSTLWPKIGERIFLDKNQQKALLISHEQIFITYAHSENNSTLHGFPSKPAPAMLFHLLPWNTELIFQEKLTSSS